MRFGIYRKLSALSLLAMAAAGASPAHADTTADCNEAAEPGSLECGVDAIADGEDTIAIGNSASAEGDGSIAVGANSRATGPGSIAIGGPDVLGDFDPTVAEGQYAIAIGAESRAIGDYAMAFGFGADAVGQQSLALGSNSFAYGPRAIAIGKAFAYEDGVAIGYNSFARNESVAIGSASAGQRSVAIGKNAYAYADFSIAIGSAEEDGNFYGPRTASRGDISIGRNSVANGSGANGFDQFTDDDEEQYARSLVNGDAIAVGSRSQAIERNAIALGVDALAGYQNSIALGSGSITTAANTLSIGSFGNERRIMNVAAGIGATDAVNKAQLDAAIALAMIVDPLSVVTAQATADAAAANASNAQASADTALAQNIVQGGRLDAVETTNTRQEQQIAAIETANAQQDAEISAIRTVANTQNMRLSSIDTLNATQSAQISSLQSLTTLHDQQIDQLFGAVGENRREARRGIAGALAVTAAPMPSAPGRTSYTFNVATYRDQQAIGLSLAHRANTEEPFALTFGASYAGGKDVGARMGVAGEF